VTRDRHAIRVLIVDDHEIVRLGLRTLLNKVGRIRVVGEAGTAATALVEAKRLHPDVVLMDVRLPDRTGIQACRDLRAALPDTRVLFLTSFPDDDAVMATILAGGDGYLLKEVSGDVLIDAIEHVAAGQSMLDPMITTRLLSWVRTLDPGATGADRNNSLSPQEQRVIALVAEGQTNKEIAATLRLSEKTVRNYLSNIFQKLHVSRRSQAVSVFARRSSSPL
jgi:two-component system, NarL family, response regulator DevR